MSSSNDIDSRSRRSRQVDWNEFYKNGVPKEIIVIDDDSPDPPRPADKKRKTVGSYDPIYNPQPSYSTTQTPYYDNSSNQTVSTDRTAPAYKATGSSSLGPSMNGAQFQSPLDETTVGQKRKRTARVVDENRGAKRRDVERERVHPNFEEYVPPPHPPKKAKEVNVPIVRDVGALSLLQRLANLIGQTVKGQG
jgi:dual-specificity kinase